MASTLQDESYIRQTSAASSVTPEVQTRNGTQITRFGLSREHLTSQRNIWQAVPNCLGHGFKDDRRAIFQDATGRGAKPAAPGLPQHYSSTATTNDTTHDYRPMRGPLYTISRPSHAPLRLNSHNALHGDKLSTMASLGNSFLLSGSAPDVDPKHSSTSDFDQRLTSRNAKDLNNFDFEGLEDFVPSYLRDSLYNNPQYDGHEPDQPTYFQRNNLRWVSNRSSDSYELSTAQEQRAPSRDMSSTNSSERKSEANARTLEFSAHDVHHGQHQSESPSRSIMFPPTSRPWSFASVTGKTDLGDHAYQYRMKSNLRPEVAVYRPKACEERDRKKISDLPGAGRTHHEELLAANTVDNCPWVPDEIVPTNDANSVNADVPFELMQRLGPRSRTFHQPTTASSVVNFQGVEPSVLLNGRSLNGPRHARTMQHQFKYPSGQQRSQPVLSHPNQIYSPASHYNNPYDDPQIMTYHNAHSFGPIADSYHFSMEAANEEPATSYQPEKSSLLQEFAATYKQKRWELNDIKHHVVEFCGDSNGSRWIQEKLDHATTDEKEQIWGEILTNVRQLMNDTYGNYVIQKLFDHGTQSQKRMLGNHMKGCMLFLSMQTYGCRVVQKAFEHVLTDQQAALVMELEGHVIKVVESQHGNHVIQKAIETIPAEHVQFIVDAHKHQVVRLARHTYGCRVIQRILEHCTLQAKRPILDELHCAIPILIDDPFGNYVIQNIVTKGSPSDRHRVVGFVQQRLLYYSTHKFASNVVEKAIEHADEGQRVDMLRQLTSSDPNNFMSTPVLDLIKDQYGNYVMQTVLKRIQGPAKRQLVDEIRHHLYMLGTTGHSKQVIAMSKTLNDVTASRSPSSISTSPQTPHTPTSSKSGGISAVPNKHSVEIALTGQGMILPVRSGPP